MDNNHSQENRIIKATIQCINEFGIEGATIRRIADIAEINSAAISYYFRSKKNLIDMAMAITLQNAFDWDNFPSVEDYTIKERIVSVFQFLLEGLIQFPGIARAHFYDLLVTGNDESPVVIKLNEFLETFLAELKIMDDSINEAEMRNVLSQMVVSVILIPALFPRLLDDFNASNLDTPETRLRYIQRIVEQQLK